MRENLINLIRKADKEDHESRTQDEHYCFMVDKLMESGVTIPVRCKDCKHCYEAHFSSTGYRCKVWGVYDTDCVVTPEHFCSYGERKDNE